MKATIWVHILSDIGRNVFRYAPFVAKSLIGRIGTQESCGSSYGNVSWREAPSSMEQLRIERYLESRHLNDAIILHVGVGSSAVAKRFHQRCRQIDGITVMEDEIPYAHGLGYPNYNVYLIDKFTPALATLPNRYHYIVDNNLSSFAPSRSAFETMMAIYVGLLETGGMILTDRVGMHYHERYAFSIRDEDLIACEGALPVKFSRVTPSVRVLTKI